MKHLRYYLAGPMTGYPQFNFPAFDAAAAALRAQGYDIVSPAELDAPELREACMASQDGSLQSDGTHAGQTWGDYLSRDVKVVADDANAIILMPGWEKSKGARLEAWTAIQCQHDLFIYLGNGELFPVSKALTTQLMVQYLFVADDPTRIHAC